jgi:hypothetical protein
MSAIITDQFRILGAKNFVSAATSESNSYYVFLGLPNPTDVASDWNTSPPAPKDSFDQEDDYWDTMVAMKKLSSGDIKRMTRKVSWSTGVTYDMYRHDITRDNLSRPSNSTNIYSANYFVVNSEFKVYICLQNGTDPENPNGKPSLDEPKFTDLEPRAAGVSGDGYVWKYLYTISPSDIVKFDSVNYIPVPSDWESTSDASISAVRDNAAVSGQIKIATIVNRGVAVGPPNTTYTRVPIRGNGSGAEATIVVNNSSQVESITISNGGSDYTFGTVDLVAGGVPIGTTTPIFNVIIPPRGGHGADIYRELGAFYVLLYSRIENDTQNPDFITGNEIARIGIIENPQQFGSTNTLTLDKASAVYALKLAGSATTTTTFTSDSLITQTVGVGSTAVGRVVSYDNNTGVLKYWQDKSNSGFTTVGAAITNPAYGFEQFEFTSSPGVGGTFVIEGGSNNLNIDTGFTGVSTVINNRTYYLGQSFNSGVSNPESKKYSGNIIFVDNRPEVTRSVNQKEDIKVILQF